MSLGVSIQQRRAARPTAAPLPDSQRRTVPFDYAFRFELTGEPEKVWNKTVSISIEAAFHAVSIGYGVISTVAPIVFPRQPAPPPPPAGPAVFAANVPLGFLQTPLGAVFAAASEAFGEPFNPANGQIGPRTAEALSIGFRLNPEFAERILLGGADRLRADAAVFQVVTPPPEQIAFKYALFDDGTGREFQSEPILNLAGLGASDGGRPFRYFAQPIEFAPRSVIRMEVRELSTFRGELHVSLQGYKVLGAAGTPTAPRGRRR